jgi:hypothetical protein
MLDCLKFKGEEWDKDGGFNETLFYHFLTLGMEAESDRYAFMKVQLNS